MVRRQKIALPPIDGAAVLAFENVNANVLSSAKLLLRAGAKDVPEVPRIATTEARAEAAAARAHHISVTKQLLHLERDRVASSDALVARARGKTGDLSLEDCMSACRHYVRACISLLRSVSATAQSRPLPLAFSKGTLAAYLAAVVEHREHAVRMLLLDDVCGPRYNETVDILLDSSSCDDELPEHEVEASINAAALEEAWNAEWGNEAAILAPAPVDEGSAVPPPPPPVPVLPHLALLDDTLYDGEEAPAPAEASPELSPRPRDPWDDPESQLEWVRARLDEGGAALGPASASLGHASGSTARSPTTWIEGWIGSVQYGEPPREYARGAEGGGAHQQQVRRASCYDDSATRCSHSTSTSTSRPRREAFSPLREGTWGSATGRYPDDPSRRRELRAADPCSNIDYLSPRGAPDNDRRLKERAMLNSRAFIESLRHYPRTADAATSPSTPAPAAGGAASPEPAAPQTPRLWTPRADASGRTHTARAVLQAGERGWAEMEDELRWRLGLHLSPPDWRPAQLHVEWAEARPALRRRMGRYRATMRRCLLGAGSGSSPSASARV